MSPSSKPSPLPWSGLIDKGEGSSGLLTLSQKESSPKGEEFQKTSRKGTLKIGMAKLKNRLAIFILILYISSIINDPRWGHLFFVRPH
jgi:hypothetical protein